MSSRSLPARGNARALLVGVSLLLMAISAAEVRQARAATEPADLNPTVMDSPEVTQVDPLMMDHILTGITLLQLGYTEQQLAQWFDQDEPARIKATLSALKPLGAFTDDLPEIDTDARPQGADRRIQVARSLPSLLSGSSPAFL